MSHTAVQLSVRWAVGRCNLFPLAVLPEYFKRGNKLINKKDTTKVTNILIM